MKRFPTHLKIIFLILLLKLPNKVYLSKSKRFDFNRGSGSIDLLIVVGAPSLDQIGDVVDSQKLRDISIINIDNNPNNQGYGDVVVINPQASSLSEHIADIALILGFAIDQDAAQNLLSGVMSATQNFQSPQTSSLAFEIASLMMKQGAHRTDNQYQVPAPKASRSKSAAQRGIPTSK